MSLTADGVWKAGVWAPTVWASGVWFEPVAPIVADTQAHGGFLAPASDHKARVRKERELLGIIPKRAQQVIQAVARSPDPTPEALELAFARANRKYRALYAEQLRQELFRLEDEEILLLLH